MKKGKLLEPSQKCVNGLFKKNISIFRNRRTDKLVDVTFDLIWIAFTKYFDFDTDLHPNVMADAIAREKWSRDYFDVLKRYV